MSKREEKKKATRQKLLETADQLIIEKGYDQLSVQDITQASGIAKGTFYNYFERKEDLIAELSRLRFRPLNHSIQEKARQAGTLKALQHYLENYCRIIEESGLARLRSWIQFAIYPNQSESKWQLDVEVLSQDLDELKAAGLLAAQTPSSFLARSIMSQIYGFLLVWCLEGGPDFSSSLDYYLQRELPLLLAPYLPAKR